MATNFRNPILPGFHPDPSICRAGEDYYLVNSSFEYFPGLPIYHSRDLVHWQPIGHVLDRPSQLNLDGIAPSCGPWAPTIRYHAGTFYVVNTFMHNDMKPANFIVTATNPAGPWSEPIWLDDAPGIDPSLFFDDDGRAWYCANRVPLAGGDYPEQREIWLQELDLATLQLTGEPSALWGGAMTGAHHAEGPHIYKVQGRYYLLIGEGGTGHHHSVTIAAGETIRGPYRAPLLNPILTHRHLGIDYPIGATGHADMVETQTGEWWMVLLAVRPYGGYYYNLGRETFLVPVRWEPEPESAQGIAWPVVAPGVGRVLFEQPAPDLPEHRWPSQPACDHFDRNTLDFAWNMLRTPREPWYSLSERPGYLRLRLRPDNIAAWENPSFVGRRQQHINFAARAALEFTPATGQEVAGLVLLQNSDFQFRCVVTQGDAGRVVQVIKRARGEETLLAVEPIADGRVYFKVEAHGQAYSFYIATAPEAWRSVAADLDGRILSTPVAGGFVGAYIGPYASSQGQPSSNSADFDWFEYQGLG